MQAVEPQILLNVRPESGPDVDERHVLRLRQQANLGIERRHQRRTQAARRVANNRRDGGQEHAQVSRLRQPDHRAQRGDRRSDPRGIAVEDVVGSLHQQNRVVIRTRRAIAEPGQRFRILRRLTRFAKVRHGDRLRRVAIQQRADQRSRIGLRQREADPRPNAFVEAADHRFVPAVLAPGDAVAERLEPGQAQSRWLLHDNAEAARIGSLPRIGCRADDRRGADREHRSARRRADDRDVRRSAGGGRHPVVDRNGGTVDRHLRDRSARADEMRCVRKRIDR